MESELFDRWIEALESGEYRPAEGALKFADGYCCLGVLCAVAGVDLDVRKSVVVDGLSEMPHNFTLGSTTGLGVYDEESGLEVLMQLSLGTRTELSTANDHAVHRGQFDFGDVLHLLAEMREDIVTS